MAPAKEVSVSPATVAKPKLKLKEKEKEREKENEKQNEKRNDRDKQWEEMGGTVLCTSAPNGRIRRTYVAPSGEKFRSWKECERFLASADKNMKNDSAQKPNKRRKATQENESQEKDRENGEEMEEEEDDKQEEAEKKSPHIKANSKSKDKSKRHKKRARDDDEEEGNADGDNENEGETKAKRKQPKRSAACDNFRETKGCEKVCKDDYVKDKKEKIVEDEATAVSMTRTRINTANPEEDEGPESLPQRRLTDFILHDEEGEIRPIEMADVMDIYITGLILPREGDVDKGKGVRCEGFGFVESWSITGYEDGVATIWFTTESGTEYECVKPNGLYKKHFDMFYDKASLCVQVYKLLSKPDGGDPLLGFDDMLARVVRSMNGGKRNSGARFYGKEYVISHGKFVVNQLFALDKDSSGSDQIFQGLPALVTLQEECQMLEKGNLDKAMPCTSGIKINDVDSLKVSSRASSEECAMNEDEKLARLLQEQENWNASKIQRKFAQSKKVYIRINENEIVNDYPMPDFYSPVEDEVDEYMLFEDTPMAAEDLPRRMLHDWCLYNAESRLVPLELVPMLPDMQIDLDVFGSGIMTEDDGTGYCLESESSANSSSRTEPVSGIRVYLSAIKEWMIEFGASMLFISIRTDGAWYRLGRPSKQYSPWYNPVLKTARIAIQIITMLKEQSRASKLSFSDVVKKLCDQTSSESTFISSSFSDVERYIVVHGQIILQQFAEYPDGMIKRSSFIVGLSSKMEQRKHTKLKLAKHKIIIKEKNLNPSASFKLDSSRPMQMHATTTKLVYRIWKEYYSGSDPSSMALENNDGKDTDEQEDQEQSDEEEETILVSDNKVKTPSPATVGRGRSSKKIEWLGKSTGKLPSGEALYRKALMHGFPIVVGGAVLVDSEGSDDQPIILFVEYMYEKSGIEFLHGRVLEKGNQTVLGNAANDREVFLTLNCLDVGLSCVKEHVSLNIRMRSWGYEYRKENAIADERDRMEAKELEKKQKPTGYYCKALYVPEKGAFFKLPLETLGIGSGECYSCNEKKKEELVFELFVNKDGFSYKAVDYSILDFVYIDPTQFASDGEEKELEIFKAGRNKGLKAYAVCQILEIKVSSAGKDILKSTEVKVRRFFRPEDVGSEKAYHADIRELFYSEETAIVSVSAIQGKCYVKRQQYFLGSTGIPIADHTFWCNCIFDPSKGTIKQLPATVRIDSLRATPVTKGKSKVVDAKMKGKAIAGDSLAEEVDSNTKKSCLATLDIFAGCGGLSLGLQQSGVCFTKWAIEYEKPAADAFKLNHPEAEVFCDNCNVILRAIMEKGGDDAECICTTEATELAAKLSTEIKEALPLPGEVEFINGGPPCQGFSGMNRFNQSAWSKVQCEMILAFLSYADYFRPKFFLLENVRNLVSFNKGQTFRLTLASLLEMGYQVRFGVLQAGNYGVAQSRKRAFIWAASPDELLPEWPEPMHVFASSQLKISLPGGLQYAAVRDASVGAPFRSITVRDTIGDLPFVGNGADKPEIKYGSDPVSWFQKQIRGDQSVLYDHISKEMNELNFIRCQRIPKRPGADWRDLPEEKVKLSTGQEVDLIPWCLPNTANKHNQWKGLFGRLDWEGNFPTSITDPQPMGKVGMCFHPEQNRIVTVRECARSQGFPDNYKFCGTIHHKHKQIGNAVPPPLAAALGKKLMVAIDANKST